MSWRHHIIPINKPWYYATGRSGTQLFRLECRACIIVAIIEMLDQDLTPWFSGRHSPKDWIPAHNRFLVIYLVVLKKTIFFSYFPDRPFLAPTLNDVKRTWWMLIRQYYDKIWTNVDILSVKISQSIFNIPITPMPLKNIHVKSYPHLSRTIDLSSTILRPRYFMTISNDYCIRHPVFEVAIPMYI